MENKPKLREQIANNIINFYARCNNQIQKIIVIVTTWFVALIPFWLFLVAKWLFSPTGFWQNIVLFGIWCCALGWLQLILLIIIVMFTIDIITDNL